jgi:PAS domain S-box-containing protein
MHITLDFIPVHNGWQKTVIIILHDVTARKYAWECLQESEQRFKSLSENAPDIIYTLDLKGCFTYVNPAWEKTLGHGKEEVLGKPFTDFVTPDETTPFREHFKRIKDTRKTVTDITGTLMHKEGSHHLFSLSAAPNLDPRGRPVGTVGLLKDISEQHRLETQLRRTEKMEAIASLAGGVAHDLNNILAGLVSYPDLLLMRVEPDSPLRKPIVKMKKSGEKVAAIVQDLLTLTRRGTDVSEVVRFSDIVSEYLQSPEYENLRSYHPHIRIETQLDKDLLNVIGSPVHLSKTVMNLISNAAESMPNGGKIRVSAENRYVDTPITGYDDIQEGDYVVLTVSDQGVGIPKRDLKRIFEPFYTKKVMGRSGTGLGMAVVWATVKDHKGYIDVKSEEGSGTTFSLYFPATRQPVAKDHPRWSIDDYKGHGEFLLVVDDVEEQREIAKEVLQTLGYSVASVSSGEEAVRYMKRNSPDLLILDMIMGSGIDGLDTYKKILEECPDQKAIIASGYSETERVREAQRLGAGPYIKKPYTLEKIGTAVRGVLSG